MGAGQNKMRVAPLKERILIRPVNISLLNLSVASLLAFAGCCTVERPCVRDVPSEKVAQIAQAMQRAGYPPIKSYEHLPTDPPGIYVVRTVGGNEYRVRFDHGKWRIEERVIVTRNLDRHLAESV
jgi:hypothetical protein